MKVIPIATRIRPRAINGTELEPVRGSGVPSTGRPVTTVVEVTTGASCATWVVVVTAGIEVVDVDGVGPLVVVAPGSVVVVTGTVVVVDVAVVDVVDVVLVDVVGGTVVVVVDVVEVVLVDVVAGTVVVVVEVVLVDVVGATVVVVVDVVGATVVVVVDVVGGTVVVVVVVVVGVVFGAVVVVSGTVVVVVGGWLSPQNCTLEMSGMFPLPTSGSASFENCALVWGGENVTRTAAGPPLTMMAAIGVVECIVPPVSVPLLMVTTASLPDGFSKTYVPPATLNLATRSSPFGHDRLGFEDVVCTRPITITTAPSAATAMPPSQDRRRGTGRGDGVVIQRPRCPSRTLMSSAEGHALRRQFATRRCVQRPSEPGTCRERC